MPRRPGSDLELPSSSKLRLWSVAFAMAAITAQACVFRNAMQPDSIAYLDMGDAIAHGKWKIAINGYWSPLYPAIQGVMLRLVHPSAYWEASTAHLVNLFCYFVALAAFLFLWREVRERTPDNISQQTDDALCSAWTLLGCSLFLWAATILTSPADLSPDVLVLAVVFAASALVLRIRRDQRSWSSYAWLGIVLGIGYLSKAVMFPVGFGFLATAFLAGGKWRRGIPRLMIAAALFLAVSAPWLAAMTWLKGRPSFGSVGTLSYAEFVNGALRPQDYAGVHLPVGAKLVHPVRKLHENPPVYEFGTPVGGSYPFWYDSSYWLEGLHPQFHLTQQLRIILKNVYAQLSLPGQRAWIATALLLLVLASDRRAAIRSVANQWPILLPALMGCFLYALVLSESRYLAPYFVLMWAGVLTGIAATGNAGFRRILKGVAVTAAVMMAVSTTIDTASAAWQSEKAFPQWQVAQQLSKSGFGDGTSVASIGRTFDAYWARLAHLKIVAEVPAPESAIFWEANPSLREEVLRALARAGAKAVVAKVPVRDPGPGWAKLGDTGYFVYTFAK